MGADSGRLMGEWGVLVNENTKPRSWEAGTHGHG